MSNDIKRFIKSAAVVAAAALSGSHANAEAKENNLPEHNIQYMQTNEPKYSFNDDKCFDLLSSAISESRYENGSRTRKFIC